MADSKLPRCAKTLSSELGQQALDGLLDQIRRERPLSPYLEIGTAAGGALRDIMLCFEEKDCPQVVVVDPMAYFPDQMATVRRNISRHGLDLQKVIFRVKTSEQAFPLAVDAHETYGLILIDGATDLKSVMTDLMWSRLLKVRGLLCVNNVDDEHKGASLAVARFEAKNPEYKRIRQAGSLRIWRKTAKPDIREISAGDRLYAAVRGIFC